MATDEEVADVLAQWGARAEESRKMVAIYEAELLMRLDEKNASEEIAGAWLIKRVDPAVAYEWNPEMVRKLRTHLGAEYEKVVTEYTATKVDTRKMLSLANKRGDNFREAVEASYVKKARGVPHIELEEREILM
jgi:hypothetical protein